MDILLNKVPVNRLNGSYSNLKNHEFFKGLDFVN